MRDLLLFGLIVFAILKFISSRYEDGFSKIELLIEIVVFLIGAILVKMF